jgi:hypothetical protein
MYINSITVQGVMGEPELDDLMMRVRKLTAHYGAKSGLARLIGVERQQLNNWLSRRFSPGGEIALQLLKWVRAKEGNKTKSPDCVVAQPERKTQLRKFSDEKPKSGRRSK